MRDAILGDVPNPVPATDPFQAIRLIELGITGIAEGPVMTMDVHPEGTPQIRLVG